MHHRHFRSPLKCSFTLDPDDDTLDDSNVETFIGRKLDKGPSYVPVSLIEARYIFDFQTKYMYTGVSVSVLRIPRLPRHQYRGGGGRYRYNYRGL